VRTSGKRLPSLPRGTPLRASGTPPTIRLKVYGVVVSIAEFEEKEFEQTLNGQLCPSGLMWPPGQVLEELVGFDVALHTVHAVFWAARGYATPPPGALILPTWWPLVPASVFVHRAPPPFAVNVFLQHKRPECLSRSNASEWSSWKAAYFRFWITYHQQAALDACATALGQNGLVAYASPAFYTRAELFGHIQKQTLVANTHFAPATNLSGHGRYTYVDAATPGMAHSEPVRVPPLLILGGGSAGGNGDEPPGREPPDGGNGRSPQQLLSAAHGAARAAIAASPALVGSEVLHAATVTRAEKIITESIRPLPESVRAFIYVAAFSVMSGIQWLMLPVAARVRRSRTSV
jgi:hypothetical protein